MRKTIRIVLFVPWMILLLQCGTCLHTSKTEFVLNDAYYQSHFAGEMEKGTTLTLSLSKVADNISFDSLIFRGFSVRADVSVVSDTMVVKGYFRSVMSVLAPMQEKSDKPDCIVYSNKGIKKEYRLKNIRRLEMKIN